MTDDYCEVTIKEEIEEFEFVKVNKVKLDNCFLNSKSKNKLSGFQCETEIHQIVNIKQEPELHIIDIIECDDPSSPQEIVRYEQDEEIDEKPQIRRNKSGKGRFSTRYVKKGSIVSRH